MAVSSTTAAALTLPPQSLIPQQRICNINSAAVFPNGVLFKPRRLQAQLHPTSITKIGSSSGDLAAETTAEDDAQVEKEDDDGTSIESPQGPPSLISALNVERALYGIPITGVDYYGTLGLPRECSDEEVAVAFKNKADELLNQGLDVEQLTEKMELLKESYTILSTPEERRMYDWSLSRSERPDRYTWPFEVDKVNLSTETPPQQKPEDPRPTLLLGYFLLGWLVLSAVLSIGFNIAP